MTNNEAFTEVQLSQLQDLLTRTFEPINTRLINIEMRLTDVETRLTNVEISSNIASQKQYNALLGRNDALVEVARNLDGLVPSQNLPVGVEYPPSIGCLLVEGNELLPSGLPNLWNKTKSIALLRFYGEDENTDAQEETSVSSRVLRLRLAKKLGVTKSQLNFALLNL